MVGVVEWLGWWNGWGGGKVGVTENVVGFKKLF